MYRSAPSHDDPSFWICGQRAPWKAADMVDPAYDTPEAAALAGWDAIAQPSVVASRVWGHHALVIVDTVPSHQMLVSCERAADGWRAVADQGWDSNELPRT